MSHGTPFMLMMALALPGAAHALGLGEIHVDSALNEPLAAEIDIVGATPEDLAGITASVANHETFLHFGADRPAFLSTVAFKIAQDSRGQPVLTIRSTEAFTDPLVSMLIDLRWHSGELIRQYTLLLDPVGFPSATRVAEALPTVSAPATYTALAGPLPKLAIETSEPAGQAAPNSEQTSTAAGEPVARKTVKVGARATLRGVAWRLGSRADADLKRMMIAIFRANPNAFEGNINRLRLGAVLTIPSASEVSAISMADANHEVNAQMETWHASTKFVGPAKPVTPAVAAPVSAPRDAVIPSELAATSQESTSRAPDSATSAPDNSAKPSDDAEAALDRRVQMLEKSLNELQGLLDREHDKSVGIQASVAFAEKAPAVAVVPPESKSGQAVGWSIAAALALATGAFGVLHAWRRRRTQKTKISPADPKTQDSDAVQVAAEAAVVDEVGPGAPARDELHRDVQTEPQLRAKDEERQSVADAILAGSGGALEDSVNLGDTAETANLPSATMKICVDDTNAETMPVEAARITGTPEPSTLEHTARDNMMSANEHVQMPSVLHENVGFKERRTSLVDVLKIAIEREPNRRDLRMKLLETYYAAAATSRQGFLEVVQKLARERENMTDGEWDKIAWMGRQIASDNDLFAPDTARTDDEDLANCA